MLSNKNRPKGGFFALFTNCTCNQKRFRVYSLHSHRADGTPLYVPARQMKRRNARPDRRCGSVETCRNVREAAQGCSMRRQDSHGQNEMAKVVLKDLKKVYPNTEKKKKKAKKGEESAEKKSSLQITAEGVVAVQQ